MNNNKTELILILDRSGSMESIKSDVEGGLKTFFEDQKKKKGECYVSLYQFDTEYEKVFENVNVQTLSGINLVPRGGTALFDAIGRTVNSVGERLAKIAEKDRPAGVTIVVITDGEENSSKEFTQAKIKDMITHQSQKYSWDFVFIGTNQDAVVNGQRMGFSGAKSITFSNSSIGTANVMNSLSNYYTTYRSAVVNQNAVAAADSTIFTEKDREEAQQTQ